MTAASNSSRGYGVAPSEYRLPAATHPGRVRLQVADLERSVAYYQTVIGLRVVSRRDGVAELSPQGADRVLVELHEKPGVRAVPRRGAIGLYHFAILLPDRAALGRFVTHLAALDVRAGMSDHGVSESIYLTDPDGLGIEVYADRPIAEWRVEQGQLAMSTLPLDVRGVVAAARGEPWRGAPAGTVIGHIHLSVRDLELAEAFYHRGLGFDKTVWGYPGALFLAAGSYHHHLGTNSWAAAAPLATDDEARLLEWELVLPDAASVAALVSTGAARGLALEADGRDVIAIDPWGTRLRIRAGR